MTAQMTLLTLAHTGHVLAAVSRVAEAGDLEPEQLAGDALPIHGRSDNTGPDASLMASIPSSQLEVKTAPFDPAVLASPHDYVINGGAPANVSGVVPAGGAVSYATDAVTVPTNSADVPVAVILQSTANGDGERRVQAGKSIPDTGSGSTGAMLPLTLLPKTDDDDAIPASIPAGREWAVVVAVGGEPLIIERRTIP